jgi:hypothetical protein
LDVVAESSLHPDNKLTLATVFDAVWPPPLLGVVVVVPAEPEVVVVLPAGVLPPTVVVVDPAGAMPPPVVVVVPAGVVVVDPAGVTPPPEVVVLPAGVVVVGCVVSGAAVVVVVLAAGAVVVVVPATPPPPGDLVLRVALGTVGGVLELFSSLGTAIPTTTANTRTATMPHISTTGLTRLRGPADGGGPAGGPLAGT